MAIEKIFIYDSLQNLDELKVVLHKSRILNISPAFINAKMYCWRRSFPIAFDRFPSTIRKVSPVTFGTLFTVDMHYNIWSALDSYYGCSMYVEGDNNKRIDLFCRKEVSCRTIEFNNILEFLNFDFDVISKVTAKVYLGNINNLAYSKFLSIRHNYSGHLWRDFLNIHYK